MKENLKKLTEKDFRNLSSIKETFFKIYNGKLDTFKYELFSSEINNFESKGFDVSNFKDFLGKYHQLYELYKNPSLASVPRISLKSLSNGKIKIKLDDFVEGLKLSEKEIVLFGENDKQYSEFSSRLKKEGIEFKNYLEPEKDENGFYEINLDLIELV